MGRSKTHIKVELKRETAESLKALGRMGDSYDTVIERLIKHARK
jgi:hypothetical protein